MVESGVPMQRIAMDILGELPEKENGNKYILVVSDYFTKWTEAFAMANTRHTTHSVRIRVFATCSVLYLHIKRAENLEPSCHLPFRFFKIEKPTQRTMVASDDKFPAQ
jgi:hypothetical protein